MKRIAFTSDNIFGFAYILLFTILMAIALPHQGLFFAPGKVTTSTVIIIAALIVGIFVTLYRPLRRYYKVPLFLWLLFAYVAYAWLTTLWAADAELAVQGALVDTAAVALAAFIPLLTRLWRKVLLSVIAVFGPLTYLFAMGAVFKLYSYTNAVQTGFMDSVFQYHNTFGAFSLATGVLAVFLALGAHNIYARGLYLLNAVLSFIGVVDSYSRWVWILTALMVVLSFAALILVKRTRDGFYALLFVVLSALAASPFALAAMRHASSKQFAVAMGIAIVGSVVGTAVMIWVEKVKSKRTQIIIGSAFTAVPLILAVLLVQHEASKLSSILNRVSSITFSDWSMRQRFWFYGAATHMWEHNPIFGSGTGSWMAKFQAYQQFPYWTTMTHSVFFSQLVSFGLIGLILWLGFLGVGLYHVTQIAMKRGDESLMALGASLAFLTVLIHSLFDFDMNFATVMYIVLVLLAMGATTAPLPVHDKASSVAVLSKSAWWLSAPAVAVIGLSCVGGTLGIAEIKVQNAGTMKNVDNRMAALQSAEHYAPYLVQPHLQLAELYFNNFAKSHASTDRDNAWKQAQWAAKRGVWDPSVMQTTGTIAYDLGHLSQAYQWTSRSYQDGKLTPKYASTFLAAALWSGVNEARNSASGATKIFQSVINAYSELQTNVERLNHLPSDVQQQWKVSVDAPMQVYAATAEYALGDYQKSLNDLKSLPKQNRDPNTMALSQMVQLLDGANIHHQPTINLVSKLQNRTPTMLNEFEALASLHKG